MDTKFSPIDSIYTNHEIFELMSGCSNFYYLLSFSVFGFLTLGVRASVNIDSYIFSSIQGTVDSTREILLKGRINDAYALLRKYHDLIIIDIYANLYSKNNLNEDTFLNTRINNWFNGTEKFPEFRVMSQYIRNQKDLSALNDLLYADTTYKDLRERCNDNTHYNFYHNVVLNDKDIYNETRISALNNFAEDFENLFILHIGYLFYINDHYLMSSDYSDSMDLGLEPEEGSQYNVAPFIQNLFDDLISKKRPQLVELIKSNTLMRIL